MFLIHRNFLRALQHNCSSRCSYSPFMPNKLRTALLKFNLSACSMLSLENLFVLLMLLSHGLNLVRTTHAFAQLQGDNLRHADLALTPSPHTPRFFLPQKILGITLQSLHKTGPLPGRERFVVLTHKPPRPFL